MGILSSRLSLTCYKVTGKLEGGVNETVYNKLKKHTIPQDDNGGSEDVIGWTSYDNPYLPDFEGYSFDFGSQMVFAMRIDKKTIPPKLIRKYYSIEIAKRLKNTGQPYLSGNEKKAIKENVMAMLSRRIPATPNIYEIIWRYQEESLWFFTTLKSANEALETLFSKTFGLQLIRLFPYTTATMTAVLSDTERDSLSKLTVLNLRSN